MYDFYNYLGVVFFWNILGLFRMIILVTLFVFWPLFTIAKLFRERIYKLMD